MDLPAVVATRLFMVRDDIDVGETKAGDAELSDSVAPQLDAVKEENGGFAIYFWFSF